MNIFLPILLLITSFAFCDEAPPGDIAITYEMKGRLGNNLVGYLHGRWVADQFELPSSISLFPIRNISPFMNRKSSAIKITIKSLKRKLP